MHNVIARPRRATRVAAAIASVVVLGAMFAPTNARAEAEIGAEIIATGGEVTVTLKEKNASDESWLYVISPFDGERVFIGSNFDTPGTVIDVSEKLGGNPPEGEELIFEIENLGTHCVFQTGPGDRNPDGVPHAAVEEMGVVGDSHTVMVGFEDLFYRGEDGSLPVDCPNPEWQGEANSDMDFNDNVFEMTGLIVNPLPSLLTAHPAIVDVLGLTLYFPSISATLTDGSGVGIANREIVFTATTTLLGDGAEICRANTDANGLASCNGIDIELAAILGLGYEASFAGDGLFEPSTDHGPIIAVAPGLEVL